MKNLKLIIEDLEEELEQTWIKMQLSSHSNISVYRESERQFGIIHNSILELRNV